MNKISFRTATKNILNLLWEIIAFEATLTVKIIFTFFYLLLFLWSLGIAYYCINLWVAIIYLFVGILPLIKRYRQWLFLLNFLLIIILNVFYCMIEPTNDLDWEDCWGRNPTAEISPDGQQITIYNIRDFRYRSEQDYDINYISQSYDLNKLCRLDFIVVHWDNLKAIGHNMLTFGFTDGKYLTFSIETRKPKKQRPMGFFAGLYKQFEILCVIGTEEDLIGLRTNYRHEDVFMYEVNDSDAAKKQLFLSLLQRANSLYDHPQFYNTLTANCATSLLPGIKQVNPDFKGDLRIILNGFSDHLAYDHNWLYNPDNLRFEVLKKQRYINPKVDKISPLPGNYSELIRK